jgi:hypothetical protein
VAEEVIAELAAVVRADIDEFEKDMEKAEKHLEELKDAEGELKVETGDTEDSMGDLFDEAAMLKGVLAMLFETAKENSGAVGALMDSMMGLGGAILDTVIVDTLLPALESMSTMLIDILGLEEETDTARKDSIESLGLYKDEMGELKIATAETAAEGWTFVGSLKDMNVQLDEAGNKYVTTADGVMIFDNATGKLLGTFKDLNLAVLGVGGEGGSLGVLSDKVQEVADETGIAYEDIFAYVETGMGNIQDILTKWPEDTTMHQIADAAEEVIERLAISMIKLGIDPNTGEEITTGQYIEAQLWGGGAWQDPTVLADYLLHGGG